MDEQVRPSCDALGLDRPDKYCRMVKCEAEEKGGPCCDLWKRDRESLSKTSGLHASE